MASEEKITMIKKHYYLIEIQYLGFRYHGWQKQPGVKTVQSMVNRTINYVLDGEQFRTLASSRTDSMVSANQTALELITFEPLNLDQFFVDFNNNLPQDIRALSIKESAKKFNIIQSAKTKEYLYLFYCGEKGYPFAAPYMTHIIENLDIVKMQKVVKYFEGEHYLRHYCYQPSETTQLVRTIDLCEIVENDVFKANFFPETSYLMRVKGSGFMRHQIRLMMGALIKVGKGELSEYDILNSLKPECEPMIQFVAPASGLILNSVEFEID